MSLHVCGFLVKNLTSKHEKDFATYLALNYFFGCGFTTYQFLVQHRD